mmetsp:Transcript_32555/g.97145  ORF Transcript_32555/g.97145 Transcript_32555/m.97145 type:complete len:220 (-) Transcript_32555:780-1439(-)|eukprot:355843-Chlamydomonas_euryale.AAC.4
MHRCPRRRALSAGQPLLKPVNHAPPAAFRRRRFCGRYACLSYEQCCCYGRACLNVARLLQVRCVPSLVVGGQLMPCPAAGGGTWRRGPAVFRELVPRPFAASTVRRRRRAAGGRARCDWHVAGGTVWQRRQFAVDRALVLQPTATSHVRHGQPGVGRRLAAPLVQPITTCCFRYCQPDTGGILVQQPAFASHTGQRQPSIGGLVVVLIMLQHVGADRVQ